MKSKLIRKRCPKCKGINIYKRKTIKDMIEKSKCIYKARSKPFPSKIYRCKCGYEFDIPFIGPKP